MIDRERNDEGYNPGNCRWTTRLVNNNNRRSVPRYNFFGEPLTIRDASEKFNVPMARLYYRLHIAKMDPNLAANPKRFTG
jgi:hypothetical protein